MGMKLFEKLQEKIIFFVGDIAYEGWRHPFWFTYQPSSYSFKGEEYQRALNLVYHGGLEPGDILLRAYKKYIDRWFIPGDLNHAGLYLGRNSQGFHEIIHAMSEGVLVETIFDFMRTDYFVVLRPTTLTRQQRRKAAANAYEYRGRPYDSGFRFTDHFSLCCTELVGAAYEEFKDNFRLPTKERFGREKTLVADDIFLSDHVEIVFMTDNVRSLDVWGKRLEKE